MTTCYDFEGTRYLRARHNDGCGGTDCAGCQQCGDRHCPECRKGEHLGFGENTCPSCIGKVRAALRNIVDLAACLPDEAEVRGVHSEAASLAGPFTDPEQLAWKRAARANRDDVLISDLMLDPDWADDEHHPGSVLKRWVQALCEDYGDDYDRGDDLASLTDWIDARLHRIANDYNQDFGQFRREVGRVVSHLEAVLHAGEQRDTGAPCMTCRTPLEKTWGVNDDHDGWVCKRCRINHTHAQYVLAVAAEHREKAEWLTAEAMEKRTTLDPEVNPVKAGTVRVWATRGKVRKVTHSGQVLYSVADVEAKNERKAAS